MPTYTGVVGGFAQGFGQGAQIAQAATQQREAKALRVKQEALQDFQAFKSIIGEPDPALREATLNQYLRAKGIDPKDENIRELKGLLAKGDEATMNALRSSALKGALEGLPLAQQLTLLKTNPLAVLEHKRKLDEQETVKNVLFGAQPGAVTTPAAPATGQPAPALIQAGGTSGTSPQAPVAPVTAPDARTAIDIKIEDLTRRAAVAASTRNTAAVTLLNNQIQQLQELKKEERATERDIAKEGRAAAREIAKEGRATEREAENPKEAERISAGFADRMLQNEDIINQLGNKYARPGYGERAGGMVPIVGKELANIARPEERQKYYQAQEDWVRAKLRKESGAVIADEEMDREIRTYFPQIGDSPQVILQKDQARALANQAMVRNAGKGYKRITTADGGQKGFRILPD